MDQCIPLKRDALSVCFYTYIIKGLPTGHFYIGSISDLRKRIDRHNKGGSVYTKKYRPFELIWNESYNTRTEAVRREREIKSWKGNNRFRLLIGEGK